MNYGLRHPLLQSGITENTFSFAIVVSEETGKISITENGILENNLTTEQLQKQMKFVLISINCEY